MANGKQTRRELEGQKGTGLEILQAHTVTDLGSDRTGFLPRHYSKHFDFGMGE